MSDAEALALFHDGIETCPACGARIEWKRSADGCSVEILHPYDPKIGPPCAPFKAFCDQLQQRALARYLPTEWDEAQRTSSHVSSAALKKSSE
jgi:hypothetical protein